MTGRRLVRLCQAAGVCILALVTMGATNAASRLEKDSHQLMCICSCNELLGECNHMDCPDSPGMLNQLVASINNGESDDTIFHQFQKQYGPVVLAAPMFTRFNHVAWIVPPLVLFLGIGLTLLLVRKWKFQGYPGHSSPRTAEEDDLHARIRRETEL